MAHQYLRRRRTHSLWAGVAGDRMQPSSSRVKFVQAPETGLRGRSVCDLQEMSGMGSAAGTPTTCRQWLGWGSAVDVPATCRAVAGMGLGGRCAGDPQATAGSTLSGKRSTWSREWRRGEWRRR